MSADYDDAVFADPFTFDIRRQPNQHVAFGLMSPHLCLGAQLARMEIKVLFEELLPRLADVRLDGPIDRLRSNFIAGIKRLPITVTVAERASLNDDREMPARRASFDSVRLMADRTQPLDRREHVTNRPKPGSTGLGSSRLTAEP